MLLYSCSLVLTWINNLKLVQDYNKVLRLAVGNKSVAVKINNFCPLLIYVSWPDVP